MFSGIAGVTSLGRKLRMDKNLITRASVTINAPNAMVWTSTQTKTSDTVPWEGHKCIPRFSTVGIPDICGRTAYHHS